MDGKNVREEGAGGGGSWGRLRRRRLAVGNGVHCLQPAFSWSTGGTVGGAAHIEAT